MEDGPRNGMVMEEGYGNGKGRPKGYAVAHKIISHNNHHLFSPYVTIYATIVYLNSITYSSALKDVLYCTIPCN